MASGPITSWQIDGETVETVPDLTLFWGASKSLKMVSTSLEVKRCLLLGRKTMTNLDSIFKSRDIILPTKDHLVKAMVFPVVMHGCESRTLRKAEPWRIDVFELCCWRRLLGVHWTLQEIQPINSKGNQSWIFIGRSDAETETPILWPPDAKT